MNSRAARAFSFMVPGGVLLLAAVALVRFGSLAAAGDSAIQFGFYGATIIAGLLAWRFRSTRVLAVIAVLALAQQPLSALPSFASARITLILIAILLPANFVMFALLPERGFTLDGLPARLGILLIDFVAVGITGWQYGPVVQPGFGLPWPVLVLFAAAAVLALLRMLRYRKPVETGFFWSLLAVFVGLRSGEGLTATIYLGAAVLILGASLVETSYFLAYHDELTGIPSRRAFREACAHVGENYSIAMVDIDHFKSFNDRYGHDTGDEVLRMVAGKLARVSGGGSAFRCGGEEFAIVFRDKSAKDAWHHLETLRMEIEATDFQVRGPERRSETRGTDRRRNEKRPSRKLPVTGTESVTVSIGVADSTAAPHKIDQVIEAADQALYRAKDAGRNRVMLATSASAPRSRRGRSKAAVAR